MSDHTLGLHYKTFSACGFFLFFFWWGRRLCTIERGTLGMVSNTTRTHDFLHGGVVDPAALHLLLDVVDCGAQFNRHLRLSVRLAAVLELLPLDQALPRLTQRRLCKFQDLRSFPSFVALSRHPWLH